MLHDFPRGGSARTPAPLRPILAVGACVLLASRAGAQPVRPDPDFHADLDRLIAGLEAHFRG